METHVASARSDAKSKKKKKARASDIFFVERWMFFSEFRVARVWLSIGSRGWGGSSFETCYLVGGTF